jgi:hypothetical protein
VSTLNDRCPLRRKGQRYDKRLFPPLLYETPEGTLGSDVFLAAESDPPFDLTKAKLVILGQFQGFSGGGAPETFDALEIEHDGWVIPAYRVFSPEHSFNICQRLTRKAVRL